MDDDGYFGEEEAARYDASTGEEFDPAVIEATVAFLAARAGNGRALELAIGTGRIAIPLARRGVAVHGIDMSRAMLSRLRGKPGADRIGLSVGDFATTRVAGSFSLVYFVFNTIGNVTTHEAQATTFRNAAAHLEPGARFVVEVGVPELRRLPPGERFVVSELTDSHVGIDEYDVERQGLVSHHFSLVDGGWERVSMPFRYVWPAELDLMAQSAGMDLVERWAGWSGEPFTAESSKHVSVWQKRR